MMRVIFYQPIPTEKIGDFSVYFPQEFQLTNSLFSLFPGRITAMQRKFSARLTLLIAMLLLVTGCGAGPNAPTRLIKQVTDGVEKNVGDIKLVHILLVAQADGSAILVGTMINDGAAPEQLTALYVNGIPASVTPIAPVLAPNTPLIFAGDTANALAVIPNLNVKAGKHVTMQIGFNRSGSETLEVLVRDRSGEFANVGPDVISAS